MQGSSFNFPLNIAPLEGELTEAEFNELYNLEEQDFFESIRSLSLINNSKYQTVWKQLDPFVREWFHQYKEDKSKLAKYKARTSDKNVDYDDIDSSWYTSKRILPRFKNHCISCQQNFKKTESNPDGKNAVKKRRTF